MSVLSRVAAPPARDEVAATVAALLDTVGVTAPADLFDAEATPVAAEADSAPGTPPVAPPRRPAPTRLLGPSGLGAAALRLPPSPPVEPVAPVIAPAIGAVAEPTGTGQRVAYIPKSTVPQRDVDIAPPRGETPTRRTGTIPRGPTGLGTASAAPGRAAAERADSAPIPPLYCPPPVRDDPALAETVNDGLIAWAAEIGLYEGRLDELRDADFGRLIMLAHPDCDDADKLLAAAKCAVSEWSVDDYYCEEGADERAPDGTPSSATAELGPRLELAAAAMDPVHLPVRYAAQLEEAMRADPILRAFRTSFEHLSRYATAAQLGRLRTEIAGWFIALGAEAGWRVADRMPPVWEYLTNRQPHSFLPCMAPIDVLGGYEIGAEEYTDPRVRRVVTTAALASQMVNDLYSMAREDRAEHREFNLPTVLAAEENCSRREAVERTAAVHDELVHRFEAEAAPLAAAGSPELRRFLVGLWAWMGGNRAWHADSKRYRD
ncbi:family 2 encapsulin nanocompartment cargo protein terpene cyclase [Nocardia takedensis]|uniref:family 2 encapsulin nanocompartment cargo protein terpene cyclase n=1 Tax=Nocardia takedensis TaxID=259390 RepID=UPI0002D3C8F7|nr:family 2 encapsulin nanocompartment cargo protein terpene cyclase [Nocardia takedensis]